LRIFIFEDEQPTSQRLIRLINQIDPTIEVATVLEPVEQATNWMVNHPHPDLIFMDGQLEDGLCFENKRRALQIQYGDITRLEA
jgi:DNA-binding LytR/AlgR family response regulator